jgi:hypothetical protein
MSKLKTKEFLKFTVIWVACNLSIPFWMVGHVHLTVNIYEDLVEIIASMGMNIVVAIGFWLNWQDESKKLNKKLKIKKLCH